MAIVSWKVSGKQMLKRLISRRRKGARNVLAALRCGKLGAVLVFWIAVAILAPSAYGQDSGSTAPELPQPQVSQPEAQAETQSEAGQTQTWNFHMQTTTTVQGYPSFSARYSGPNSLPTSGEVRETVRWICLPGSGCGRARSCMSTS